MIPRVVLLGTTRRFRIFSDCWDEIYEWLLRMIIRYHTTAATRCTNDCHELLTTGYCANVCWCCSQLKDLHEIVHDFSLTKTILDSMNDYRNHSQTPWLITNYERYTLTDYCPMRLFIDIRYLTFLTSLIYHSSRCSAIAGSVQCILSTIILKFNVYTALIQDSYIISYINLSEV